MSATTEEIAQLVRAGWRVIALETFEEDRALGQLERAAKGCERALFVWSIASGLRAHQADATPAVREHPGAGSLDAALRAIAAEAKPALFALLDAQRALGDPIALRRIRDALPLFGERRQTLVLVGPVIELPLELLREVGRVSLPLPGAAELQLLFRKVAEQSKLAIESEDCLGAAVRGALGLTSSEAIRVLRRACRSASGLNAAAVEDIVREKRRALRRTPALSFHEDDAGMAQVGGLTELKRWLVERRRAFGDDARAFGLPEPRGLLLLGVQGCGKSLCAKAVAREWQLPLLRLDVAALFAGGQQGPEASLREAVQVAESLAPCVLWIDEIEKGFHAAEADPAASRVFGGFLTWLSEKRAPVFVVATANDVKNLPPELLRRGRFDELFFVDLPSAEERSEILAIHLRRRGRDPAHYRLEELSAGSERLTGAELEQAVAAGLYTAFAESRELEDDDLENAIQETVPIYDTYEERIKELRDWARGRARPASLDGRVADWFAGPRSGR
jgi:SpoVK/Ycf46/Vps4 family AAA+-type ATPase